MTAGLHATNLANGWLNLLRNTAFTAKTAVYAKLHTGDPGSAGTANASAETDRKAITFNAASGGSMALTGSGTQWTAWDQGAETITHFSVWDDPTAGNFLYSVQATTSKSMTNGDTLTLTSHTVSFSPIAA